MFNFIRDMENLVELRSYLLAAVMESAFKDLGVP
jgi:hypothetical protein